MLPTWISLTYPAQAPNRSRLRTRCVLDEREATRDGVVIACGDVVRTYQ